MRNERANAPLTESSLYRAVWRWHFYAGLLVLPFLVLLAVTGGLYLFKPELDAALYRSLVEVPVRAAPAASASVAMANVERAMDGRVQQLTFSEAPNRSVRILVRVASGEARTAFADPYDGHYLGSTPYGGVMQVVRKLHSLQQFGFWASCLIEIAAGWSIVLVGTGFFLWWPRERKGGVVSVRGAPTSRMFWRDLHAVTGAFAGVVILFLAVTGMPWSMFWGDHVQKWATAQHLSRPAPPAEVTPGWMLSATMPGMSHAPHDDAAPTMPWALQQTPAPHSHAHGAEEIGLDRAVARFEQLGLKRPFSVQPPEGPNGAYVGSYAPDRVEQARTLYLDRASGDVLGDVGYAQYGPAAQAIEWGIAVHQGTQYGQLNRMLMLAGCIAIVLLAVSAATMWWKRRPKGRLAAPPAPTEKRAATAILCIIAIVGLIYPLVGASLIAALMLDTLWSVMRAPKRAP
jgi:uncharacterized iron-regulated membrane protein